MISIVFKKPYSYQPLELSFGSLYAIKLLYEGHKSFEMDTATPAIFMDSINCFINPSVYLNTFHAIHKNIPKLNQMIHQKNHPFPLSFSVGQNNNNTE